jgi:hypothetical protein
MLFPALIASADDRSLPPGDVRATSYYRSLCNAGALDRASVDL